MYDKIKNLNEINKNKLSSFLNNKNRCSNKFFFKITKKFNNLYIEPKYDTGNFSSIALKDTRQLISFLTDTHNIRYITNISVLKNSKLDLTSVGICKSDWHNIINSLHGVSVIDNLYIVRKENINNWISKILLLGGSIIYNFFDIIFLVKYKNDFYIVSEFTIKILVGSNITLSYINAKNIEISNLDISCLESLQNFFLGCSCLESVELRNFDLRNVKVVMSFFESCTRLKDFNLDMLDFSNVEIFDNMFCSCTSLVSLDLSKMNVSKGKSFTSMFSYCTSLKLLDISTWCAPNCEDASYFCGFCNNLKILKASLFFSMLDSNSYLGSWNHGCLNLKDII